MLGGVCFRINAFLSEPEMQPDDIKHEMRAAAQGQHVAHRQPSLATAHDKGLYALNRHAMPSVGRRDQAWPSIQVIQGFSANSQASCPSELRRLRLESAFERVGSFLTTAKSSGTRQSSLLAIADIGDIFRLQFGGGGWANLIHFVVVAEAKLVDFGAQVWYTSAFGRARNA